MSVSEKRLFEEKLKCFSAFCRLVVIVFAVLFPAALVETIIAAILIFKAKQNTANVRSIN